MCVRARAHAYVCVRERERLCARDVGVYVCVCVCVCVCPALIENTGISSGLTFQNFARTSPALNSLQCRVENLKSQVYRHFTKFSSKLAFQNFQPAPTRKTCPKSRPVTNVRI